jgi:hypothetical protein
MKFQSPCQVTGKILILLFTYPAFAGDYQKSEIFSPIRSLCSSPGLASPLRVRAISQAPWINNLTFVDESNGAAPSNGFWLVSTSLEDKYYRPVRPGHFMDALEPADPAFRVSALKLPSQRYALKLTMDKSLPFRYRPNAIQPAFLFGAVNDSFDLRFEKENKPSVADDIRIRLDYRINRISLIPSRQVPDPRIRFCVGMAVRHQSTYQNQPLSESKYVEINLFRSSGYDYCISGKSPYPGIKLPPSVLKLNSDPIKIYDLRHCWGAATLDNNLANELQLANQISGEMVYYNSAAISDRVKSTRLGNGWNQIEIPISLLMKIYSWSRPPADWAETEVGGIYFGMEAWGNVRAEWEIKEIQIDSIR